MEAQGTFRYNRTILCLTFCCEILPCCSYQHMVCPCIPFFRVVFLQSGWNCPSPDHTSPSFHHLVQQSGSGLVTVSMSCWCVTVLRKDRCFPCDTSKICQELPSGTYESTKGFTCCLFPLILTSSRQLWPSQLNHLFETEPQHSFTYSWGIWVQE